MVCRRLVVAICALAAGCRSSIGEPPYTPTPPVEHPPVPSLTPDRFTTDTTVGALRYHLVQETRSDRVDVSITATNVSTDTLHLRYGACLSSIRLHRFADFSDVGLFDPTLGVFVCQAYLVLKDLAPNESIAPMELEAALGLSSIAATSLPSGRYYLRLVAGQLDQRPGIWPSNLVLPAGAVTLAR